MAVDRHWFKRKTKKKTPPFQNCLLNNSAFWWYILIVGFWYGIGTTTLSKIRHIHPFQLANWGGNAHYSPTGITHIHTILHNIPKLWACARVTMLMAPGTPTPSPASISHKNMSKVDLTSRLLNIFFPFSVDSVWTFPKMQP